MMISCQVAAILFVVAYISGVKSAENYWKSDDTPVCGSRSGLCGVSFEIEQHVAVGPPTQTTSSSEVCKCPGRSECPNLTSRSSRVMFLELSSPGQTIRAKLAYCKRRSIPRNTCRPYELVVTLRGYGPIITEIVGDVMCRCDGPLLLHKAMPEMPEGRYSLRQYTCGKPTCEVNRTIKPVCESVERTFARFGIQVTSVLQCQCPAGFQCESNDPYHNHNQENVEDYNCKML